jgi:chaperone BCS1
MRFTEKHIYFDKLQTSIFFDTEQPWDMSQCCFDLNYKRNIKECEILFDQYKKIFDSEFFILKNNLEREKIKDINFSVSIDICQINETEENITDIWNNKLYQDIIEGHTNNKHALNEINVYLLKVVEEIIEEEIPNPDFADYMHRKEMFETFWETKDLNKENSEKKEKNDSKQNSDKNNDNKINNAAFIEMNLHKVPPMTIKKKIIRNIIQCQKEGIVKKKLETLYLKKKDICRLKMILHNFVNCSDIYEDLCISKKLGFMLDGEPGTGKSSTIMAIATYLNYDIYYVSLNGIKKNSQIKMIFDHVTKNCSKKGMLVFEDIDAQTNIVHKRKNIVNLGDISLESISKNNILIQESTFDESNLSMISVDSKKDDDLDLSYFLNVLDGTISQTNLVYAMTTNHIEQIDPAIYRHGRINVILHLTKCDHYQIACIFEKIMKKTLDENILKELPENVFTPAEIIHHLLEYRLMTDMSDQEIMENLMENKKK